MNGLATNYKKKKSRYGEISYFQLQLAKLRKQPPSNRPQRQQQQLIIMKLMTFIIFTMSSFLIIFIWITILSSLESETVTRLSTGGQVIDLQADHDNHDKLFTIKGFEFMSRIPSKKVKIRDRVLRRLHSMWALMEGTNGTGSIQIGKLQDYHKAQVLKEEGTKKTFAGRRKVKREPEPVDVVVEIRYYISSDENTSLTVMGTNNELGEQTMEMLDSIVDPSMICSKLVYLGPVDNVMIEGWTKNQQDFVVIDDLKIAIGVDHESTFGDSDEISCSSTK